MLVRLFLHITGSDSVSGEWYGFWSGFGSDVTEFAILGYIVKYYQHTKCARCLRIGHYHVEGTPYKTCHKHSTVFEHNSLQGKHELEHPEQHQLFKIKRK